ncbi:uncharacterized protein si:ch211-127m7.2 [Hoplias malabaricus]|uniref:uncharacterized protein si:ch211-127m7.2 n=1 Tax=Hoplias malabaricus TaxID=27720 RepID=UPI0034618E3D
MSVKRSLPSWMMTSCEKHSERKTVGTHTRERKRKRPERKMLYWMNEVELMDTTQSVLKRNGIKRAKVCPVETENVSIIPETDSEEEPDSDVQERSCISDSDLNVAEQETLAYITSTEKERSSTKSDTKDQLPFHLRALEKESDSEDESLRTDPDPDALQLIRDIFFS